MFGAPPRRRLPPNHAKHSPKADLGTFPFAEFRSLRAWEAFALALRVRFIGAPFALAWPRAAREAGKSRRTESEGAPLPSRPPSHFPRGLPHSATSQGQPSSPSEAARSSRPRRSNAADMLPSPAHTPRVTSALAVFAPRRKPEPESKVPKGRKCPLGTQAKGFPLA